MGALLGHGSPLAVLTNLLAQMAFGCDTLLAHQGSPRRFGVLAIRGEADFVNKQGV